jgi:hypothetical protein
MSADLARYPGRAPIDAYGNGGFRFADMSHRGSILCRGIMPGTPRRTSHPRPGADPGGTARARFLISAQGWRRCSGAALRQAFADAALELG